MSGKFIIRFLLLGVVFISSSCSEMDYDTLDEVVLDNLTEVEPSSLFEQNAYIRALQYSSLIWIPKKPVPRQGGERYFPANEKRQGMLYAEGAYQDKRVGYDVSLYTFLTALNNPYSLLYTENINESHSHSAHGITYHGDSNSGAYMGVACNSYVYWVLGSMIPFSSYETAGLANERGIVNRIEEQSSQALHLMDILQIPGHVRMITRLWTDRNKSIKAIEISEALGGGVQNTRVSSDAFDEWLNDSQYTIYRFNSTYSVGDVSPLSHIDAAISSFDSITYNNELCTFAGDCASYGENDLIILNYTKADYRFIEIYRNEELIDVIPLDKDSEIHEVDLTGRGYGWGDYKARLVGDHGASDFTYWEVLNIDIQIDGSHVLFNSQNATPLFWGWYKQSGWAGWKQSVSEIEIMNGELELTHHNDDYPFFKLYVQGRYGRITTIINTSQTV